MWLRKGTWIRFIICESSEQTDNNNELLYPNIDETIKYLINPGVAELLYNFLFQLGIILYSRNSGLFLIS